MQKRNLTPLAALALIASLGLAGCAAPAEPTAEPTTPKQTSQAPEPAPSETETESPEPSAEAANGPAPEWFTGATDVGELIGETQTDSWDVRVYQVGTGTADTDSREVDPDTKESLLPAGTEVVFLNFVYTNRSDNTLNLNTIPDPALRLPDWKFLGGQPGVVNPELYRAQGIEKGGYDVNKVAKHASGTLIYAVAPGESIAEATSIAYEPGTEPTAKLTFSAKDDADQLIDAELQEATVTVRIK